MILLTQEAIFGSFPVFVYPHCVLPCLKLLIFLLERFHLTTAAAVILFLLYIFLDLNSYDAQEPFILNISLSLSLKLFHEVPLHHFQIVSYFL